MQKKSNKLLYEARKRIGLSQGQLAKALGLSTAQYISNIERGLCPVPIRKVKKFCKILKIEPKVLTSLMAQDYEQNVIKINKIKN